jgi:predicted RNase H-like nuclease
VVEVYPAAALRVWGFDPRAYKTANHASTRALLVTALRLRTPWLAMTTDQSNHLEHDDDVLDALIAALIARAAATGLIEEPLAEDMTTILREGWIALPRPGTLDKLVSGESRGE